MYRFLPEAHNAVSLRKITILEQTQGRKREIRSHTAPHAGCPRCCRLRTAVWPRRAKVGYGIPPSLFGCVLGSFSVRRKRSRRKGRRRGHPRPGHFCPQCGQFHRVSHRGRKVAFSVGGGDGNRKSLVVTRKTAGSRQNFKEEN